MERLTSSEESVTVSLKLWPPYTQGLVMPREVENDVLDGEDEQMLQALAILANGRTRKEDDEAQHSRSGEVPEAGK